MKLRYLAMCCIFLLAAAVQCWVTCVLFLTRQTELLLLFSIGYGIFWAWSSWKLWRLKFYTPMVFAALCLAAAVAVAVVLQWGRSAWL